MKTQPVVSIILAAGRGSRMKGFEGNKTLLPLVPGPSSPFEGSRPILIQILENLPPGPRAVVVNHCRDDIVRATRSFDLTYCEQPELNGTGGALLASGEFIRQQAHPALIITMGDVPLVKPATYLRLVQALEAFDMVVLGFSPHDKKQYGVLEIQGGQVTRIVEWKYWSRYPEEIREGLRLCNSGIYAVRRSELLPYLKVLESRPHTVVKERNKSLLRFKEYFITDLVEYMHRDGLRVGHVSAENEQEVMGIDDVPSLLKAQSAFRAQNSSVPGEQARTL